MSKLQEKPVLVKTFKAPDHLPKEPFPLSVRFYDVGRPVVLHRHEFMELVIVSRGRGKHITDEDRYPIEAGDVFAITGRIAHEYSDVTDLEVVNVLFDPSWFFELTSLARKSMGFHALFTLDPRFRKGFHFENKLHLRSDELQEILTLIHRLIRELEAKSPVYEMVAQAIFLQIVGLLSRFYDRREIPLSNSLLKVGRCLSFMEHHYTQPIVFADLAKMVHISPRTLRRIFQKTVGVSPIDYLIRLRIEKSRNLLQGNNLSITEIAFQVGFTDSNYFSRQFKKITGISPKEFKRISSRKLR